MHVIAYSLVFGKFCCHCHAVFARHPPLLGLRTDLRLELAGSRLARLHVSEMISWMAERDAEGKRPRVRRVGGRALTRVREQAATPGLGSLLLFHASGAAGDALVALALAGSLFFSVPEATARERVALYLALTVAPFAVVTPLLSRVLDRHRGSLRAGMMAASLVRGSLAWLLATRLDSLYLFPIAFGLLVASRSALVIRAAVLPDLVPPGRSLVAANSSLSKFAALAGMVAVLPGLAVLRWAGAATELQLTAAVYCLGAAPLLRLRGGRGRRPLREQLEARVAARALPVRQALVAAASMRFLVGFLVFHLAFALRREHLGAVGLGLLVAGAAFGALLGALLAPRVATKLREEGILVAALVAAGLAGVLSGRWFSLTSAVALVFTFGLASGAAKVAFDAIVQRETPEAGRGWAFARFESRLQLAWVAGALVPLALPVPGGIGVGIAGAFAILVALVFAAGRGRALSRRHARTGGEHQRSIT